MDRRGGKSTGGRCASQYTPHALILIIQSYPTVVGSIEPHLFLAFIRVELADQPLFHCYHRLVRYKWDMQPRVAIRHFPPAPLTMSPPSLDFKIDYYTAAISASALAILAAHLVPYVVDAHGIRYIPGPWLAKFTDAWMGRVAAGGHRSEVVHEMHKQYGEYVSPVISK